MIFKLANPLRFQKFAGKFQSIFLHLSLMFLVCGLFFSFFNSPPNALISFGCSTNLHILSMITQHLRFVSVFLSFKPFTKIRFI